MRLRSFLLTILFVILAVVSSFFIYLEKVQFSQPFLSRYGKNRLVSEGQNLGGQALSAGSEQAFLLPISENSYLPARDFNVPEPVLEAKAAALFDVQSGRFLYSKNINRRLPIASITKLMSAIVVLENLNLNEIFTVPPEDINVDGNGADFYENEQLRGTDLFKIMLIKSSNDAALAFATAAQKAGIDFVAEMNEKAQAIGMFNTKFADPAGLADQDAFSTASDLVKLMRYAGEYDLLSQALKTKSMTVTSADGKTTHRLVSTNQLLGRMQEAIMGKTGYTDGALGTIVLEAEANNGRDTVIGIILGSNDRFGEAEKLIRWGESAYRWE
jgi:D-alanyl-D-alanine carboxypeptidase